MLTSQSCLWWRYIFDLCTCGLKVLSWEIFHGAKAVLTDSATRDVAYSESKKFFGVLLLLVDTRKEKKRQKSLIVARLSKKSKVPHKLPDLFRWNWVDIESLSPPALTADFVAVFHSMLFGYFCSDLWLLFLWLSFIMSVLFDKASLYLFTPAILTI